MVVVLSGGAGVLGLGKTREQLLREDNDSGKAAAHAGGSRWGRWPLMRGRFQFERLGAALSTRSESRVGRRAGPSAASRAS
jgi:hypothetical protein